jgi:hypothetical protein
MSREATAPATPSNPRFVLVAALLPRAAAERRGRRHRVEELAWERNHPGKQDEQVGRDARADELRREIAERMADDDDVPAVGDRIDHGAGVRPPAGRLLLARKINCYGFVPALAQLGNDQMPVPRASSSTVDQRERRHDRTR